VSGYAIKRKTSTASTAEKVNLRSPETVGLRVTKRLLQWQDGGAAL
jgi:hypothetical protein